MEERYKEVCKLLGDDLVENGDDQGSSDNVSTD